MNWAEEGLDGVAKEVGDWAEKGLERVAEEAVG